MIMEFTAKTSIEDILNTTEIHTIFSNINCTSTAVSLNQTIIQNATTSVDDYCQRNTSYSSASIPLSWMSYTVFVLTCLVTAIGLCGNSLILATMFKGRTTPLKGHDILISALAIFDGIALVPSALSQPRVYEIIGVDVRALTTIGCKLFMCVFQSATFGSLSVIVLICIERFVAVWCPLRSKYLLSRTLVLRCLLITLATVAVFYIAMAILYSETSDGICDPNFSGKVYSSVLGRVPDTKAFIGIMGSNIVLYLGIMSILTPLIIVKLYQQLAKRRRMTSTEHSIGNLRTSVILTAVVVAFLVFVALPIGIGLVMSFAGNQLVGTSQTRDLLSWLTLALLLNHSTNFIIYNIFDQDFRKKALSFFWVGKDTIQTMVNTENVKETSFMR